MAAGTSQAKSEALLAAFNAGVKRAIIRTGSCVTLYSENKHRELLPAPDWPYKSKCQLKTVPGHGSRSGHAGGEVALHREMLQVRAGEAGAQQTQPALCPASLPGAQPLAGSGLSKRETGAVQKNLLERNWLSTEHTLISAHRRQTLQCTQKAKGSPWTETTGLNICIW